uniref:Uncharacterized protein n=1 Tax=Podoviridae sp. ct2iq11 TaxID=2827720 RepID=A0A8S5TPH9_9CAUD|nr:MAG TPA: hypothetical protein [Podoviridae sp. ct2iq11]
MQATEWRPCVYLLLWARERDAHLVSRGPIPLLIDTLYVSLAGGSITFQFFSTFFYFYHGAAWRPCRVSAHYHHFQVRTAASAYLHIRISIYLHMYISAYLHILIFEYKHMPLSEYPHNNIVIYKHIKLSLYRG